MVKYVQTQMVKSKIQHNGIEVVIKLYRGLKQLEIGFARHQIDFEGYLFYRQKDL